MPADTVQLKLFASLTPFSPKEADSVPITPDISVKELLLQFDVPLEKVHLIFVNGVRKTVDTPLNAGDRVGVFPPVAGG
jgi:molybdopterin synthase sulfur carrier subunit